MNGKFRSVLSLLAVVTLPFPTALLAKSPNPAATGKATITITAIGKKDMPPPAVSKDDIQLSVNKERKQVAGWEKADALGLAILIDDSLDSTVASQWNDLKDFIMAQSPNTAVAISYASNSSAVIAQDFTTDHALAAKALRIPRGQFGIGSSPYLAVIDWLKRWPD